MQESNVVVRLCEKSHKEFATWVDMISPCRYDWDTGRGLKSLKVILEVQEWFF